MPPREIIEAASRLSRATEGVVQRGRLLTVCTEAQVRSMRDSGIIDSPFPGVYRFIAVPWSPRQDALVAVYAARGRGSFAGASHRTANAAWGFIEQWPRMPEVVVRGPRRPRLPGVAVHRSVDLLASDLDILQGLPLTTPLLSVLHLGAVAPDAVAAAVDRALVLRRVSLAGLRRTLEDTCRSGRDGSARLRQVVEHLVELELPPLSRLEIKYAQLSRKCGLPAYRFRFVVRDVDGRFVAEVDFAYPAARLAIEVDGYGPHSSPTQFQRDRSRQNDLVALGWTVLRFTWSDVVRRPEYVAETIREVLRALMAA